MIRLRPYKSSDAAAILSWCKTEKEFYQWTAGRLGEYPITEKEFDSVTSLMPFVAFDESGLTGFFTLRVPEGKTDELRFGFVICDSEKRGRGCGKEILRLGMIFAFDIYHAKRVSLGVFENNPAAYHCYKAAGFKEAVQSPPEIYHVMGEDWKCLELVKEKEE